MQNFRSGYLGKKFARISMSQKPIRCIIILLSFYNRSIIIPKSGSAPSFSALFVVHSRAYGRNGENGGPVTIVPNRSSYLLFGFPTVPPPLPWIRPAGDPGADRGGARGVPDAAAPDRVLPLRPPPRQPPPHERPGPPRAPSMATSRDGRMWGVC